MKTLLAKLLALISSAAAHAAEPDRSIPASVILAGGTAPLPTLVLLHGLPGNEQNLDLAQAEVVGWLQRLNNS